MADTPDDLQAYALALARPAFCETQLRRFLAAVTLDCRSRQDVDQLYREWRSPREKGGRPRVVTREHT